MSSQLRVARALYMYVVVSCLLLSLGLPWTNLTRSEAVALARVLLFLIGGVAGWIGISGDYRRLRFAAVGVGAIALVEFLTRLPALVRHYDVAVANASWFGFLGANSIFVTLAVAGYLTLRYGTRVDSMRRSAV